MTTTFVMPGANEPRPVYALAWSGSGVRADDDGIHLGMPESARLAVGSFVEEQTNRIQVLETATTEDGDATLNVLADTLHPYPATKLGFQPTMLSAPEKSRHRSAWGSGDHDVSLSLSSNASSLEDSEDLSVIGDRYPDTELLASSAECLHIWEIERTEDVVEMYESMSLRSVTSKKPPRPPQFRLKEKCALAHAKSSVSPPAPLTSFSWNAPSPNLIVTSSIDTTCTIWDLPTRSALTQLIAHDREVYDVDWCPGSADVFASVGADGSVRVFDLRNLEHSTIIYETEPYAEATSGIDTHGDRYDGSGTIRPLLRIAFNPWDANYLATFHQQSDTVQILDVRAPGSPILELRGHSGPVNSVSWGAPSQGAGRNGPSKGMICTGGDDAQCLVYDLASTTLRTASAQGRRSRNSSLKRSSTPSDGLRIGAEVPVLAYTAPSMVNNVSWLRSSASSRRISQNKHRNFYRSLLHDWTDYTATPGSGHVDWLALAADNAVKVLRV